MSTATAFEVGKKLVALCKEGKNREAVDELYSHHVVSVEAMTQGPMAQRSEGIAAIKAKTEWWYSSHTIHSATINGPWPHGDRFIAQFIYDVTVKAGPMAGKRMTLDEVGLYTVKDGKVIHEEFFYGM